LTTGKIIDFKGKNRDAQKSGKSEFSTVFAAWWARQGAGIAPHSAIIRLFTISGENTVNNCLLDSLSA
jgi:hypothetical protein